MPLNPIRLDIVARIKMYGAPKPYFDEDPARSNGSNAEVDRPGVRLVIIPNAILSEISFDDTSLLIEEQNLLQVSLLLIRACRASTRV